MRPVHVRARLAPTAAALLASLLLGCGAEEEPRAPEGPAPPALAETSLPTGRATIQVESSALVPERTENPPVPLPLRLGDGNLAFGHVQASTALGTWGAYDRAGSDGVFDIALSTPGASAASGEAPPSGQITTAKASSRLVAERPTHQTSPSLAAGPAGRMWLAFEEGEADWGRGANLRRARKVVFGEVLPSGDFAPLEVPLTDAEAPSLCVDGLGRPWLFARQLESWLPLGKEGQDGTASNRRVAWTLSASVLTAAGWSAPLVLPHSDGPEDGALELEATAIGVRARYFTDQRRARIDDGQLSGPWDQTLSGAGAWFETRLSLDGGAAPEPTEKVADPTAERDPKAPNAAPARALRGPLCLPTGARVLWGDLHRHTDASRCKMEEDGDLADAYRYALGTARLDFLAVTDHFQHMTPAVFEREVRTADAYDALEGFVAFPGYERALPLGHWTMVAASEPGTELVETAFQPFRPRHLWDDHDPAV
ncbi:MAG: hypothetical protein H8D72_01805, partial [Planctomycetes bacterium]|nr:hypothetical protein [Planctomycetota bacterium]